VRTALGSLHPRVSVHGLNLQTIPIMSHVTISPVSRHSYGSTRGVRGTRRNRRQRSVTPRLLDTQCLRAVVGNYATSKATPSSSHPPPPPALIYKRRCLDRCLHAAGESALWVTLTPSWRFTTAAVVDRSLLLVSFADLTTLRARSCHEKLLIAKLRFTSLHFGGATSTIGESCTSARVNPRSEKTQALTLSGIRFHQAILSEWKGEREEGNIIVISFGMDKRFLSTLERDDRV